jgi:hypothetical protein
MYSITDIATNKYCHLFKDCVFGYVSLYEYFQEVPKLKEREDSSIPIIISQNTWRIHFINKYNYNGYMIIINNKNGECKVIKGKIYVPEDEDFTILELKKEFMNETRCLGTLATIIMNSLIGNDEFIYKNLDVVNANTFLKMHLLVPLVIREDGTTCLHFNQIRHIYENVKNNYKHNVECDLWNDDHFLGSVKLEVKEEITNDLKGFSLGFNENEYIKDKEEAATFKEKISRLKDKIESVDIGIRDPDDGCDGRYATMDYCRKLIIELEREQDLEEDEEN